MKQQMTVSLAAAALVAGTTHAKDTCRALVFSGGGNNGAWEVGVLSGMLANGNAADFEYDVVTGVSAGSINAGGMAGWAVGQELEAAQWLSDTWNGMSTSDVWVDWNLGKVSGALLMGGTLDDAPLLHTLQRLIDGFPEGYKRRVTLAAVDVATGVYTEFDQTNTDFRDLPQAAISSASIPFVFPPHHWHGRGIYMDGGTVYNINMEGAINQCLDLVDDESQIELDVYICGAPADPSEIEKTGDTWSNYFRHRQLHQYITNTDSMVQSMEAHRDVKVRYVVKQAKADYAGGLSELNFNGEFTWHLQEAGRQDAIDALNGTNGVNVRDYLVEWSTDSTLQRSYPRVGDFIEAKVLEVRSAAKAASEESSPFVSF